jgi:hypothetical protein
MVVTSIFSLFLIGLSGYMLDMHRHKWREADRNASLPASERRYALTQYRRRMQASGIIGALGMAIMIGPLVPHRPWPFAVYLASLAGSCLAIVLLAALDAWATRQHFARLQSEHLATQAKLAMKLRDKSASRAGSPGRRSSERT